MIGSGFPAARPARGVRTDPLAGWIVHRSARLCLPSSSAGCRCCAEDRGPYHTLEAGFGDCGFHHCLGLLDRAVDGKRPWLWLWPAMSASFPCHRRIPVYSLPGAGAGLTPINIRGVERSRLRTDRHDRFEARTLGADRTSGLFLDRSRKLHALITAVNQTWPRFPLLRR
jgi:hypothetical protein